MTTVTLIPVLRDNYCYILETPDGACVVIDAGEADPVIAYLERRHLIPAFILNTHHHGDHTAGNSALQARYACDIYGPEKELRQIPSLTKTLKDKDILPLGMQENIHIIETSGHTQGALCYHLPASHILFTGDTLFSMGCGRLMGGTAEQFWQSLQKISALPDETLIYCGHEYTQNNGAFGLHIEPDNPDIQRRMQEVEHLRAQGKPTLPVTLGMEKKTNVFLRAESAVRFAQLRHEKDGF